MKRGSILRESSLIKVLNKHWLLVGLDTGDLHPLKSVFSELSHRLGKRFVFKAVSDKPLDWSAEWLVKKRWRLE